MQNSLDNDYKIEGIFPISIYMTKRGWDLEHIEREEIKEVIEEGMHDPSEGDPSGGNWTTHNSYIFNTKLKKLKRFCEKHIDIYVEQTLNPKEEINYYITQSWLSITNPGEWHPAHTHPNSIISGVFYIDTEEDDIITFIDPNSKVKSYPLESEPKEINMWNSPECYFGVENNLLVLFPSWMTHQVPLNTAPRNKPRMTIAFNTFGKGKFGIEMSRHELIL
tara:strand:+ start:305 stop:967 length:663 start_codon:yes stop_codon:yes gene_type:complete